jgi:RHH-type rel operon transcriptional repressor/antitoxin RelB
MGTVISIRISDKMVKKLDKIANETEKPRSFHIQRALENYLEEQGDLEIALDRLRDKEDPIISMDEMRKLLGL